MKEQTIPEASIVVGVDGSEGATRALNWAAKLAQLQRRPLVLLHAGASRDSTLLLQMCLEAAKQAAPDVAVLLVDTDAKPAETLAALSSKTTLLVLGWHHGGALRNAFVGSTAVAVARRAACPMVVVHRPVQGAVERRSVVVGVIGDEPATRSLDFAYQHASWTGAPLTVLHCFWDVTQKVGIIRDLSSAPREHRLLAEAVAGLSERYPDVPVRLQLAHGFSDRLMSDAAQRAGLVVLSSDHTSPLRELVFGSLPRTVLAHATCDVAVIPEAPRSSSTAVTA
ncbi:universal stress protein [Alloalcanivorax gelatiniphagus]